MHSTAYDRIAFVAFRTVTDHPIDNDGYCCLCCMIVTLYHLIGDVGNKSENGAIDPMNEDELLMRKCVWGEKMDLC